MTQENQVLYEEEIKQIDRVLIRLIKEAEAKCALLVDKDGHLITRQGFTHTLDTTALAALLAGSFASTKEIAFPSSFFSVSPVKTTLTIKKWGLSPCGLSQIFLHTTFKNLECLSQKGIVLPDEGSLISIAIISTSSII